MSALEDLLREATLALEVRSGSTDLIEGTGFLVAPGIVATCAHVLAERPEALPGTVTARTAACASSSFKRCGNGTCASMRAGWTWRCCAPRWKPGCRTCCSRALSRRVRRCRRSATRPASSAPASRRCSPRRAPPGCAPWTHTAWPLGGEWEPERVFGTPVRGGYSGSAVLSRRTGAVCGMLCLSDRAGSAHLVSAKDILAALPQIAQVQSDPARNSRWLAELDDDQIRIGGWPYPGPRLRAYLDAAILAAREHPYPGLVPGTRPPPLTTVHVRQQARPATPPRTENGAGASPPAEHAGTPGPASAQEILDHGEGAVVIAGPGAANPPCCAPG